MTRKEITGERPTEYSKWHRTLPDNYPMLDLDSIEVRNGIPVAIIELGRMGRAKFTPWQKKIVKIIATALGIPAFFVEYKFEDGSAIFRINNLFTNKIKIMNKEKYSNFIMGLKIKNKRLYMFGDSQ